MEESSSPFCGVPQEHEVANASRTLLCQQRRVSVPVQRTDIFTPVAQVYRSRQSLRVAQPPSCPDPSRRVCPAVGGRIRPAVSRSCQLFSLLRLCGRYSGALDTVFLDPQKRVLELLGWPRLLFLVVLDLQAVLQRSGPVAHATAGESERIIGLCESDFSLASHIAHLIIREFMVSHLVSAALSLALLLVFLLLLLCLVLVPRVVHCLLLLCHACLRMTHPCMMEGIQGGAGGLLPVCKSTSYHLEVGTRRRRGYQKWEFRTGRRFAPCLRGGGRGKFSAGRRCSGAGCRFTSQEATRHWYQAGQGRSGHTFSPPEGSWFSICVTWTWVEDQAINGLDEGGSNHTVGDLGAEG